MMNMILAEGRWSGAHGIGRFSHEILSRLQHTDILNQGPAPLSLKNLYWLPQHLLKLKNQYRVYFSPSYLPPIYSPIPFVFTIHDLIHLHAPDNGQLTKKIFYNTIIKPGLRRAAKIITVSEYSKSELITWSRISADKIDVIKNGISHIFLPTGIKHSPGYSYFFYPGNTKPHKNVPRLLQAFAAAKIDTSIKLILTGEKTIDLQSLIRYLKLESRVVFSGVLTEIQLAEYYRGALGLLFPSLYEGFGLPIVEAMASGIPVMTSNTTSLPEVACDAAILVNPLEVDALAFHIEQLATNDTLRKTLIAKGFKQVTEFSWDQSARQLQQLLDNI